MMNHPVNPVLTACRTEDRETYSSSLYFNILQTDDVTLNIWMENAIYKGQGQSRRDGLSESSVGRATELETSAQLRTVHCLSAGMDYLKRVEGTVKDYLFKYLFSCHFI